MGVKNVTDEQLEEFSQGLLNALARSGKDLSDLIDIVKPGVEMNSARKTIYRWTRGLNEPSRPQVALLEQELGCQPGELSAHLGYLPISAIEDVSVETAISLDESLNSSARELLIQLLHTLRDQ